MQRTNRGTPVPGGCGETSSCTGKRNRFADPAERAPSPAQRGSLPADDVLMTCTRAKAELRPVFETDQLASIFQLLRAGFGATVIPAMASSHSAGCKLVALQGNSFRRVGY